MNLRCLLLFVVLLPGFLFQSNERLLVPAAASTLPSLTYHLKLDQASANAGLASVVMTYSNPISTVMTLTMHSTTGGWYDVFDVRDYDAFNEKGESLPVQYSMTSSQQQAWTIIFGSAQAVSVQYKVYLRCFDKQAGGQGGGTFMGYLGRDFLLAWAGWIFLLPTGYTQPLGVKFDLPPGWVAEVPWPKEGDYYVTKGGEEFASSTVGLGPFRSKTTQIDGSQLTVAVHSQFSSATAEMIFRFASDAFDYVVHAFGGTPPPMYLAVYTPYPEGSNSRNDMIEAYNSAGDSIAGFDMVVMYSFLHRLVHTFNAFQPTGMGRASGAENWFSEGCNVYYDSKIPFTLGYRRDLNYMKDYLQEYEQYYGTSSDQPLASVGNLSGSEGRSDRVIFLQYNKGALACMVIDNLMLRATNGTKSFDTVLQEMYKRFGGFKGRYSNSVIQSYASEKSGFDFTKFFQKYVLGKEKLPLRSDSPLGIAVDWSKLASDLGPLPGSEFTLTQTTMITPQRLDSFQFSIDGSPDDWASYQPIIPGSQGGGPGSRIKAVYGVTDGQWLYVMIKTDGRPDLSNSYIFPLDLTGNGHYDYSIGFNVDQMWMYNLTGLPNGQWPNSRLSTPDALYAIQDTAEIIVPLSIVGSPTRINIVVWINQIVNGQLRTVSSTSWGTVGEVQQTTNAMNFSTTTNTPATMMTWATRATSSTQTAQTVVLQTSTLRTTAIPESETTVASVKLAAGAFTTEVLVIAGLTFVILVVVIGFYMRRRGK